MSGLRNFCTRGGLRKSISTKPHCNPARSNECITEEDLDQLRCRPTSCSTNYKSSTLNFDLNRGPNSSRVALSHILILPCCHSKCSYIVVIIESTLTRGSPNTATFTWWDLGRHDRSCLDMSEADGVDSGAICKRGFIHLQFAEKPEAPEAERHLGSRILEPRQTVGLQLQQPPRGGTWVGNYAGNAYFVVESFGHSRECPSAIKSPTEGFVLFVRRLFVHAGLANLRVNSPLARGSPDAATSTRWDLGRGDNFLCESKTKSDL
ncbi:hypothetical protein V1477_007362 [Vespula maculifrons]|uniref:Uncharacterized protein n=1 Tax=Vespula maculifrons TaxID=7453 RepID=A0ABD2CJ82_VESMC